MDRKPAPCSFCSAPGPHRWVITGTTLPVCSRCGEPRARFLREAKRADIREDVARAAGAKIRGKA